MMMFKTWGYITMAQALTFASDFKLGHYMKIPPRPMFFAQVVATAIAGTVQLGVQSWMFSNIPYVNLSCLLARHSFRFRDICQNHQKDNFICPSTEVFGTASIIVRSLFSIIFILPMLIFVTVGCHWASVAVLSRRSLLVSRAMSCIRFLF